jgi:protein-tyrosine phosphatase
MAEGLLAKTFYNKKDCVISSAGLNALVGHKPDDIACQLMQEKGIDISHHNACQFDREMALKADLILVMESAQKITIEKSEPSTKGKVFRLGEWGDFDIPDPYNKDTKAFEYALELIQVGVTQWIEKI